MVNVTIREARERDTLRLLGFWRELFRYNLKQRDPAAHRVGEYKILNHWRFLQNPRARSRLIVADIASSAAGYVLYDQERTRADLKQLFVSKIFRHQGVGSALLKEVAKRTATKIPLIHVYLFLPHDGLSPEDSQAEQHEIEQAREFYARHGFYNTDEYTMVCDNPSRILRA